MRTVDRLGVHIEQCEGCRGIFLDYGELEQISGAERGHYAAGPMPHYEPPRHYPDSPPPYGHHGHHGQHGGHRRRSFLEELFD